MRYLIYYLLFISSTLFAQDSLKQIPVVKWKLDKLLDVYFYDQPSCMETVDKLKSANDSVRQALADGGVLIKLRTEQRDAKAFEVSELRLSSSASQEAHKIRERQQRKRGRVEGISVAGIVVIVLLVIL